MKRLLVGSIPGHATRILVVIGATILLVLAGCKKDNSTDAVIPPPPQVYENPDTNKLIHPLNLTSIWNASQTIYNSNGSVATTGSAGSFQFTRDSLAGGTTWYFASFWNYWFYHGPGGVWWKPWAGAYASLFRDSARSLLWKWPAKLNDTYSCVMNGIPSTAKVVSLNYQITIQGRFLNCVGYEYRETSNNALITTMYLFPGIGFLLEDAYYREFNTPPYIEIMSYRYQRWWITSFTVP